MSHDPLTTAKAGAPWKRPDLQEKFSVAIQIILQAGDDLLMKKALQPTSNSPDVFVTFFIVTENEQSERTVTDTGSWWGTPYGWYGPSVWTRTELVNYTAGLLVLDIVDVRTSKLIWRAYCTDTIHDMRTRDKNITATVKKALDRFPPKHK